MDEFKRYLQQHSGELDSDLPGDAVWQRIQQTSVPSFIRKRTVRMRWRLTAAACILLFVAAGIFLLNKKLPGAKSVNDAATAFTQPITEQPQMPSAAPFQNKLTPDQTTIISHKDATRGSTYASNSQHQKNSIPKKRQSAHNPVNLVLKDLECNYNQLAKVQLKQLRSTPVYAESPAYFSSFKQQYKQIERDEILLKKEIQLQGLTDELLQQFIIINQQKLTVLKELRSEIGKLNRKVQPLRDDPSANPVFYMNI